MEAAGACSPERKKQVPATNQKNEIAHQGGQQRAFGGGDACLNGTYENAAVAGNIGAGSSTKTLIEGNVIAMQGTLWTPSASGGILGTKSGTTKAEAKVTTGSPNLFIENMPAARVNDPSTQNAANSAGVVQQGTDPPSAESVEERAKKKCKLTGWKGTNGKAFLGYPGKDKTGHPNLLELWDSDTVTFTAYRADITKTPAVLNPKCEMAPHSKWSALGWKFPLYQTQSEPLEPVGVDTLVVPAMLVVESWANAAALAAVLEGDIAGFAGMALEKFATTDGDVRSEGGANTEGLGRQDYGGSTAAPVAKYAGGEKFDGTKVQGLTKVPDPGNAAKGADEPIRGAPRAKVLGAKFEGDPRAMMFYAWWWAKPPEIKVTASSCGGALDALLRVFPNQKVKFKFTWDMPESLGRKKETIDAGLKKQQEDAQGARDKAGQDRAAADQRADAQVAKAIGHLEKADAIGDKGGAAQRGSARENKKADKAFDKAKKSFADAESALAKYQAAQKTLDGLVTSLKTMEQTFGVLHKIAAIAGVPLTYELMKDFSLEFEISYERTEDKASARGWRHYTTATMGQKWTVALACGTVVGLSWKAYFSLLQLATFYIPFLADMLRRFRIFRVDLFCSVSLSGGLSVAVVKKEHDEFTCKGEVKIAFTPTIGLVVGGAGVDVVQATVSMPSEVKCSFEPPKAKGSLIVLKPGFRAMAFYKVVIFPDRWWEIEACAGQIPGFRLMYNQTGEWYYEPIILAS